MPGSTRIPSDPSPAAPTSTRGEPVPGPHTGAEVAAHVRAGVRVGGACLVCGGPIVGDWTDYNGQVRCVCGTTYQILGSHLTAEWLAGHGVTAADVAREYCDCYEWVPLLRAYWAEAQTPVPFGTYFVPSPVPAEHVARFYAWVARNEARLRPAWDAHFDWDVLLAHYADSFEGDGL